MKQSPMNIRKAAAEHARTAFELIAAATDDATIVEASRVSQHQILLLLSKPDVVLARDFALHRLNDVVRCSKRDTTINSMARRAIADIVTAEAVALVAEEFA